MFSKISLFRASGKLKTNLPQKYSTFMIHSKYFLKHVNMKGRNILKKVTLINFSSKSNFVSNGKFATNLAEKYANFYLIIRCKDFFLKRFSMTNHNSCTKLTLFNFPKNIQFLGKWPIRVWFGPKLFNFISHE